QFPAAVFSTFNRERAQKPVGARGPPSGRIADPDREESRSGMMPPFLRLGAVVLDVSQAKATMLTQLIGFVYNDSAVRTHRPAYAVDQVGQCTASSGCSGKLDIRRHIGDLFIV